MIIDLTKTPEHSAPKQNIEQPDIKNKGQWAKEGFKPKSGEEPFRIKKYRGDGFTGEHHLYTADQMVAIKRKPAPKPAELIDTLAAVFEVTRYAKRCRDAASRCYQSDVHGFAGSWRNRKDEMYRLKGQALHYLLADGRLEHSGYHLFEGKWAELLTGGGYSFHRPCPSQPDVDIQSLPSLADIEAKPKESAEPRLTDAVFTLEQYLSGKKQVQVYEWPVRKKKKAKLRCYHCGYRGHVQRDCPERDDAY